MKNMCMIGEKSNHIFFKIAGYKIICRVLLSFIILKYICISTHTQKKFWKIIYQGVNSGYLWVMKLQVTFIFFF